MAANHLLLFGLFINLAGQAKFQELLGATIYWWPTSVPDEFFFRYSLTWKRQSFPCGTSQSCYDSYISKVAGSPPLNRLQDRKWNCVDCISTPKLMSDLTNMKFITIDSLGNYSFETGAGAFKYKFDSSTKQKYTIKLESSSGKKSHEAEIHLLSRNDTGRMNVSPTPANLPVYRVPLGCSAKFKLLVWDGDGDYMKCGWAPGIRNGVIQEERCELLFDATNKLAYSVGQEISLDFYVYDYTKETVSLSAANTITSGPFSKVPLRLTVQIQPTVPSSECSTGPKFEPVPAGIDVGSYTNFPSWNFYSVDMPCLVPDGANSVFLTSGPRDMVFSDYYWAYNGKAVYSIKGNWTSSADQEGIHVICVAAYTQNWVPGESGCVNIMVEDPDECYTSNPCPLHTPSTCYNRWHRKVCDYPEDPCLPASTTQLSTATTATAPSSSTAATTSTVPTPVSTTTAVPALLPAFTPGPLAFPGTSRSFLASSTNAVSTTQTASASSSRKTVLNFNNTTSTKSSLNVTVSVYNAKMPINSCLVGPLTAEIGLIVSLALLLLVLILVIILHCRLHNNRTYPGSSRSSPLKLLDA